MPPKSNAASEAPSRPSAAKPKQPSNKRKDQPEASQPSQDPRKAKRPKPMYEVRAIATEASAVNDGELNVQSFVNSMAFEINAMDESMRRTRNFHTSRAFQGVPFTMRRRTAAHNYKRIPKRLHRRAQREMAQDNTPTVTSRARKPRTTKARLRAETARKLGVLAKKERRVAQREAKGLPAEGGTTRKEPKIRQNMLNDPPITSAKHRKRQRNKTWLPTHLWHAKRARMSVPSEPLWGFSLPLTTTQKNYRPTHRVQWQKGAMAWDMSYIGTIGLFGRESNVQGVLKGVGLTQDSLWSDRGKRWRSGAVHWTGVLSRKIKNNTHFIGPATIIWNPQAERAEGDDSPANRQVFIRIHPSAFLETFNELLKLIKAYKPHPYIQDLRHEIGSIDLTGPGATEALLGVLKASESDSQGAQALRFKSLLGLRDPSSLPLGALLAFSVVDPRLTYPPRKVELPPVGANDAQKALMDAISSFRQDGQLKPYQLFDRDARSNASKLPSQKSINRRRVKMTPGAALEPTAVDPPIPLVLLASRNSQDTPVPGSWTIILPWKCVSTIWLSLLHFPLSTGGNPAFGGIDEIRQLEFERKQLWFPGDYLGTDAGNAWEQAERGKNEKKWMRRPKSKRIVWDHIDLGAGRKGEVGNGTGCDFDALFKIQQGCSLDTTNKNGSEEEAEQERDDENLEDTEMLGPEAPQTQTHAKSKPTQSTIVAPTYIPKTVFTKHLTDSKLEPLPPNSVITVQIRMQGRGVVSNCARIYRLPSSTPTITATASSTTTTTNRIAPEPPSNAEVPGTVPPPSLPKPSPVGTLPSDLRAQWLAQPRPKNQSQNQKSHKSKAKINAKKNSNPTPQERQQALAHSLISTPPDPNISIGAQTNRDSMNGHPLCPNESDLIGFVTTGAFSLREGVGEGIGCISAVMAKSELESYKGKNGKKSEEKLCVVRDAGQSVGWLARWEIV
ncbi:ribonucleases P/MRP protein subunit POP1-domain-containing protein [Xylariaceae sp. FL1019]|nr:ribonucleases P/MRP protein subunit POP1-domain-containing protein [Xylariaceae sp. FL1019]